MYFTDDDPAEYTQVPDSVYFDPDVISVVLEEIRAGATTRTINLQPSNDYTKEEGAFTTEGYFTYKTNTLLKADREYRLIILNTETGFRMESLIIPLGRRNLEYEFRQKRYTNVNLYKPEKLDYNGFLTPGQFDKQIMRLLYYEYSASDTFLRVADWRYTWTKNTLEDTALQLSDGFLQFLSRDIPTAAGIKRQAVGVDKMIILNDELLTQYMEYFSHMEPAHYIPHFTNFSNGAGLFASRYYYTYFAMELKDETLDSLAYGRFTKDLGFLPPNPEKRTE
jgi:hypothetical protein